MNEKIKQLLKSNIFVIALLVIVLSFIISYLSNDVVLSDKVYQKHLDEQYEQKYNEYKDLDLDLSEFEEELEQFEQSAEDSSYGWDVFYYDLLWVTVPLLVLSLGFSGTFLILILFHKTLHSIRYLDLLKATLVGYLIFYVIEVISAIYFLLFKKDYELNDIRDFEGYFYIGKLFDKDSIPSWLSEIVWDTSYLYFVFPLVMALLLKILYTHFKTNLLIGYAYLSYGIVFLFYNTVFWYLFDLF